MSQFGNGGAWMEAANDRKTTQAERHDLQFQLQQEKFSEDWGDNIGEVS